eukprot:gene15876-21526_t
MTKWLLIIILSLFLQDIYPSKVIIPAVYKEWEENKPDWFANPAIQKEYNFTTFLYQKLNPDKPNYVNNQGTEGGVYLKYIVDHYDSLPDVMIFVHAKPEDHQPHWLKMIGCINEETANFISINSKSYNSCRGTSMWKEIAIWVEQCWRDVLRIVWDLEGPENTAEFERRLPVTKDILICSVLSNQFIISREMVLKRPLKTWKKLLHIINEQPVCHEGQPEYDHLFTVKVHPNLTDTAGPESYSLNYHIQPIPGRYTQGGAMEHLSHVIFGMQDLDGIWP